MKSTKFAVGGDEAKIAAFGGALAESVLDDASAEERDDSGGDESDDGKHDGDDDSSEVEGAEALLEAKYEAILQVHRERLGWSATGFSCSWRAGSPCTFRRFFLLRDEIW